MPRDTLLFDINETTLDLAPMRPHFRDAFGDEGVAATWFARLLHASTVCVITNVQTDFGTLGRVTLDAVAARSGVTLTDGQQQVILDQMAHLPAHADVKPALVRLRSAGFRPVAFTNSSHEMAAQQIDRAGLTDHFDDVVSVEIAGTFKPDAAAYRFVADHVDRPLADLRLIAAHDWDTHGALSAGMSAAYLDRSGAPYSPLYQQPDIRATSMGDIVDQIIEPEALSHG